MKKLSAVLLSMLLLLSISQAAFAQQNYLGVMVGGSNHVGDPSTLFAAGLKLNYNLSPKFSINAKVLAQMDFEYKNNYIASQVDARFKVLELLIINAGVAVGTNMEYATSNKDSFGIGLTAGIYADVSLIGSLSIYADAKVVVASFSPSFDWFPKTSEDPDAGYQFIGSVGLMYNVLPMLTINGEVGYQAGSIFFTAGAGLTF